MASWRGSGRRRGIGFLVAAFLAVRAASAQAISALAEPESVATPTLQAAAADPSIQDYIAAHPDTFAGDWFSTDGGRAVYNVGFTLDVATRTRELSALFAYPAQLDVHTEQHSLAELQRLSARVADEGPALAALGVRVVTVGPDVPANAVAVGVSGSIAAAQEHLAAHLARVPITVHSASTLRPMGGAGSVSTSAFKPLLLVLMTAVASLSIAGLARFVRRRSRPRSRRSRA